MYPSATSSAAVLSTSRNSLQLQEPKTEPVEASYEYARSSSSSSTSSTSTLPSPAVAQRCRIPSLHRMARREYLMQDIDSTRATSVLWCLCFMSGFINSVPFTAILLWCGFQTGNTAQLAIAIGRMFTNGNQKVVFEVADQQALVSLLAFLGGGYIGRYGDRMGSNTRAWLLMCTIGQAGLTMAAALTIWRSGEPGIAGERGEDAWMNLLSFVALGFASASQGLQGVMAKRINSHFGATAVLTTLWCELIGDPDLFRRRHVKSRDHRIFAVLAFISGGIAGRALLTCTSSAAVLGVGAGFRVLISLSWLFVPSKD